MSDEACAIQVSDLSFAYAGAAAPVLRHATFAIPRGSFTLVIGGTGSGKSTLLRLMKPQIAPAGTRTGDILVFGREVGSLSDGESAQAIGYVFQNPENQVVCDTVAAEMAFGLENLGVAPGPMRSRIAETSYFLGLDQWFHDATATLSGGRKQLLALACALTMRPRILVLDEPTAQLDPIAERSFLHALFRANRELGCTVVVATHRPQPMADYAKQVLVLADGAVAELDAGDPSAPWRVYPSLVDGAAPPCARPQGMEGGGRPAVELRGAWFRYARPDAWVLRGLDATVSRGAITALVGGNGSGKSTILKVMARIVKLQRGGVRGTVRAQAMLPQDPKALFVAETVGDELMEWASAAGYTKDDAMDALVSAGLPSALESRHPYDLSGGEQQLLALVKTLLVKPELLLLDEPTKGLDETSRRRVAHLLLRASASGAAVVMASHDLDFVRQVAHRVAMVFDGEVACSAPAREFFEDNVYYRP